MHNIEADLRNVQQRRALKTERGQGVHEAQHAQRDLLQTLETELKTATKSNQPDNNSSAEKPVPFNATAADNNDLGSNVVLADVPYNDSTTPRLPIDKRKRSPASNNNVPSPKKKGSSQRNASWVPLIATDSSSELPDMDAEQTTPDDIGTVVLSDLSVNNLDKYSIDELERVYSEMNNEAKVAIPANTLTALMSRMQIAVMNTK